MSYQGSSLNLDIEYLLLFMLCNVQYIIIFFLSCMYSQELINLNLCSQVLKIEKGHLFEILNANFLVYLLFYVAKMSYPFSDKDISFQK